MLSAAAAVQRIPIFGRMFSVDESTGLEEINSWPGLIVMTSLVWLVIAVLIGLTMPVVQLFELGPDFFYSAITLHGAALAFPFAFQLMVGVSLHRSGGCRGTSVSGPLTALFYIGMNGGAVLFTIAVLFGLKISYAVMYPLPLTGVELGQWSMGAVVLGFTGLALVLSSMILFYPLKIIRMLFFEKQREDLLLSPRSLNDPGMVGMTMAVFVLLVSGAPLIFVAGTVLLGLYGVLPLASITWATEPVVFQYVFYIFAHNLMEAMAIMVISAAYATLPLYLADGTRELYSKRLANLALWILLVTSVTSFFHHFFNMYPAQPAALAYHGNFMSFATAIGAALSIFTILATIWKHGLKPEPGVMAILMGFVVYILDGASAIVLSNIAVNTQLHGTMAIAGHTMNVLIAISFIWMGVLYHHYPVITGRKLDRKLGNRFVTWSTVGAIGLLYTFLAAGAAGMPRRFADWGQNGWMLYGVLILVFGTILLVGFATYLYNLLKSEEIENPSAEPSAVPG